MTFTLRNSTCISLGLLAVLSTSSSASAQCPSTELAPLDAYDAFAGDQFGRSVAIDGYLAAVGAPEEDFGTGMVYLFEWDGMDWRLLGQLTAAAGSAGDKFGTSVSLSGDVLVVGAYQPGGAIAPGLAYVFEKPANGWVDMNETATLSASDGQSYDNFGYATDIDQDTIVVGAYLDDDGGTNSGTAFVFERPIGGWVNMTETGKLTASDTNLEDQFGISVAIHADQIVVGADRDSDVVLQAGSAYLFEQPQSGWADMTETAKLTVAAPVDFDRFGLSVATADGVVVVGAWGDDGAANKAGAAFVFLEPMGGWVSMHESAKLTASNAAAGDHFGWAVDMDGNTIVVGAPANLFDGSGFGASYVFQRPASGWATGTEDAILTQSNAFLDDEFGTAVSVSEPLVHVGARFFETQAFSNSGASYLFGGNMDCNQNGVLDLCEIVSGSGTDADGDGRLDSCGDLGSVYCSSPANSTGFAGTISASGSNVASDNNLQLLASNLPTGQFAYFIGSQTQGLVVGPGGSQGNLCVLGSIARFTAQVGPVTGGQFGISVDLTDVPEPPAFGHVVMAGETWNFQCWHRDVNPGATSNFTNGISITYQ